MLFLLQVLVRKLFVIPEQIYNLKIQGTIYQNLPNTVECEDDNEKALGGQLYIYI